jgi:S-formylglutathione hydrolase FrmB
MPVPNPRRLARRTTRGGHLQCRPEAPLKPTPLLLALLFAALPGAAEPRLEARLVSSPALSRDVRVVVQLPPSYDSSPARRYPVLYFLHDGFGNENVLARRGLATRLDAEMAAGRLPEMLVVSPRGVGTWFTDSHDGKVRYGTFLDASLVPRIDGEFRTLARRSARAAAGISMGGYGAVRWGLRAPELFAVTGGLSPAVQQLARRSAETIPLLVRPAFRRVFGDGRTSGAYREHDLASILLDAPGLAARAPELLLRCGTEDEYLLADVSSYFHKLVTALGGRSELVLERGGHDWDYWRSAFLPFVSDLARRLDAAEEVS